MDLFPRSGLKSGGKNAVWDVIKSVANDLDFSKTWSVTG